MKGQRQLTKTRFPLSDTTEIYFRYLPDKIVVLNCRMDSPHKDLGSGGFFLDFSCERLKTQQVICVAANSYQVRFIFEDSMNERHPARVKFIFRKLRQSVKIKQETREKNEKSFIDGVIVLEY